jgi:hypothetical protein
MEAVRTSETSVDNHFTRQYNPEDSSEHHTRRRENLKSHKSKETCEERYLHSAATFLLFPHLSMISVKLYIIFNKHYISYPNLSIKV